MRTAFLLLVGLMWAGFDISSAQSLSNEDALKAFEREYLNASRTPNEDVHSINLALLAGHQRFLEQKGFHPVRTDFVIEQTNEEEMPCDEGTCKFQYFRFRKKMVRETEILYLIGEGSVSVYTERPYFRQFDLLWESISRDDVEVTPVFEDEE